jgi:hypothetical protein
MNADLKHEKPRNQDIMALRLQEATATIDVGFEDLAPLLEPKARRMTTA